MTRSELLQLFKNLLEVEDGTKMGQKFVDGLELYFLDNSEIEDVIFDNLVDLKYLAKSNGFHIEISNPKSGNVLVRFIREKKKFTLPVSYENIEHIEIENGIVYIVDKNGKTYQVKLDD